MNFKQSLLIPVLIFIFFLAIYLIFSPGGSPYNYFSRLANSFVRGKLYLTDNPAWLNELIPIDNKFYVVYPPMPAILMAPLVLILPTFSQTFFSIILGAVNVVLVYLVLQKLKFSKKTSLLVSVFFGFGTNHFFLASVGSAWYLAHVVSVFFLLLALLETFGRGRLLIIGLCVGASFWSRTPTILSIIFFTAYFWKKFYLINPKSLARLSLLYTGVGLFVILDALYNYARFSVLSPLIPYQMIPRVNEDPVFREGFINIAYIPRHIEALFWTFPKFENKFPFVRPTIYSLAIWISSPAFIYALKIKKNFLTLILLLTCLAILLPNFLWAGVGYIQFGYRFIQDLMPFLLILVAFGIGKKPSRIAYFLVFLSILVNLWGVFVINKLNIATY